MATCTHYSDRVRCHETAIAHLVAPDGELCPGARVCWDHGVGPLVEYQEKLGESWSAVPVDEHGSVQREPVR